MEDADCSAPLGLDWPPFQHLRAETSLVNLQSASRTSSIPIHISCEAPRCERLCRIVYAQNTRFSAPPNKNLWLHEMGRTQDGPLQSVFRPFITEYPGSYGGLQDKDNCPQHVVILA